MARARSAYRFRQVNDSFALSASRAARESNAQLLSRGLRNAHQYADEALGHRFRGKRFLDEVRYAILNTQSRSQACCPAWLGIFEFRDGIESLLHRTVVAARGGFLAETDERSAEQRLQLDVSLLRHLLANLNQSILQPLARCFAVKLGELTKADGGFLAGLGVFIANARSILQQNVAGGIRLAAAEQFFDVLLHVARRNAPRFA